MTNLDCTVILLSYNSLKVTDTCLTKLKTAVESTEKKLGNKIYVIVVDNASSDGSVEMIRRKHKYVNLMALSENVGYARGNNIAMEQVKTPYILLMNSDTYVYPNSLTEIISNLNSRSGTDILVCRHFWPNGKQQLTGGYTPTPLKIFLWTLGFESLPIFRQILHRIYGRNLSFYKKESKVEWYAPNFFLMKREVYDKTHGFDEQLFFHMVDIEWCHRINKAGFKIIYTPAITVIHLGGASSTDLEDKLFKDNFNGLFHYCQKHYPDSVKFLFSVLGFGLQIRHVFYTLAGKPKMAKIYKEISQDLSSR